MTGSTQRIKDAYARRDATKGDRYAWHQPDVINQDAARQAVLRQLLHRVFGNDLSSLDVLDVGCGTGLLLRGLIELGVSPSSCTGIDLLPDRIETAIERSHPAMQWHVGGLAALNVDKTFDLVTAWTVLSSVVDADARRSLIDDMWDRVRPGGWLQIFDFRFNNPRNPDVRRVRACDLGELDPAPTERLRRSLITSPPLARRLCSVHPRLDSLLSAVVPAVRSHQIHMLRRGN
jgi:SAM-dependent methyltransferase